MIKSSRVEFGARPFYQVFVLRVVKARDAEDRLIERHGEVAGVVGEVVLSAILRVVDHDGAERIGVVEHGDRPVPRLERDRLDRRGEALPVDEVSRDDVVPVVLNSGRSVAPPSAQRSCGETMDAPDSTDAKRDRCRLST